MARHIPTDTELTISEAARVCGVNRRTLQRAIQAGRLPLTAAHRIDTADLRQAGVHRPRGTAQHRTPVAPGHRIHAALHATGGAARRRGTTGHAARPGCGAARAAANDHAHRCPLGAGAAIRRGRPAHRRVRGGRHHGDLPTVIAEALAGYLGHWAGRYGNLDDDVERAQQILALALGLHTDSMGYTMREGDMTADAIAQMLGRVLVVDLPVEEEAP